MTAPKEKPAPPLAMGAVVAEKYRIEMLLGEGGMGFVFAAQHLQLGHRVALKVLHTSAISDKDVTERFLREGRALARLQGEHIARVSDVGTLPTNEPYLVMEFLEGRDLARELTARGPIPVVEVVEFMAQACEALAEAHVRGIVHRDLKPANLFLSHKLDGDVSVKVLDFGISKIAPGAEDEVEQENITVTSTLVGTPKYMSPEQIQDSRSVDSRTDIWGLGTIFYELLTQQRPFSAPTLALVCVKVLHEEVPPPSSIRPDIPPGVDAIIARCLKKDPAARYASVGELVEALVPFGNPSVRSSATRVNRILAARGSGKLPDSSGSLPGIISVPSFVNADSGQPVSRTPSAVRVDKEIATLTAATVLENLAAEQKTKRNRLLAGGGAALVILGIVVFALTRPAKQDATTTQATSATPTETHVAVPAEPTKPVVPVESAAPVASATASEAASVAGHPPIHKPNHHGHAQPGTTSTSQGSGDVLEDRR